MVDEVRMFVQIIVALGIFNVWLIRYGRQTMWRGGEAQDLKAEFQVYGLPNWFMVFVGVLKVFFAFCLVLGFWFPELTRPAAMGLSGLMLGAIAMHFKVGDPLMKSLPAISMLLMSLFVAFA